MANCGPLDGVYRDSLLMLLSLRDWGKSLVLLILRYLLLALAVVPNVFERRRGTTWYNTIQYHTVRKAYLASLRGESVTITTIETYIMIVRFSR